MGKKARKNKDKAPAVELQVAAVKTGARDKQGKAEKVRPAKAKADKKASAPSPEPRVKLIRDSFTMPFEDFELIAQLKERTLEHKRPTKKSELLRAGLQTLMLLSDVQLLNALASLRPLKAGRPKHKR